MRRLVLLVAVLGLVAGCGGPVAGTAVPTTASASTRPKDIRLDGIDPCSLFTPAVRQELRIDRPLQADKGSDPIYQGDVPSCGTRVSERPLFSITVVFGLQDGIELFAPGRVAGTLVPIQVGGYQALTLKQDKYTDECAVVVDVGPGQVADFTYTDGGNKPQVPQNELCELVQRATDLLMPQLVQQA